jgi:hypothetical protein
MGEGGAYHRFLLTSHLSSAGTNVIVTSEHSSTANDGETIHLKPHIKAGAVSLTNCIKSGVQYPDRAKGMRFTTAEWRMIVPSAKQPSSSCDPHCLINKSARRPKPSAYRLKLIRFTSNNALILNLCRKLRASKAYCSTCTS